MSIVCISLNKLIKLTIKQNSLHFAETCSVLYFRITITRKEHTLFQAGVVIHHHTYQVLPMRYQMITKGYMIMLHQQ